MADLPGAQLFGAVFTTAIFPALARTTAAQEGTVRLEGKVTWIAADKMAVAPPGGLAVTVDLSQVDLEQYRGLMGGDRVIVEGTPSLDGKRPIATSIQRIEQ